MIRDILSKIKKELPVPPVSRHIAQFKTYEQLDDFATRNNLHDCIVVLSYGESHPYAVIWDSEKDRSEFK